MRNANNKFPDFVFLDSDSYEIRIKRCDRARMIGLPSKWAFAIYKSSWSGIPNFNLKLERYSTDLIEVGGYFKTKKRAENYANMRVKLIKEGKEDRAHDQSTLKLHFTAANPMEPVKLC